LLGEVLFAASIGRDHAEYLEYLDLWLHGETLDPAVRNFYRWVLDQHRRGEILDLGEEKPTMDGALADARVGTSEKLRTQILDMIDQQPGMKGNYHRLRSIARVQFLIPLREEVEGNKARSAFSKWRESGTVDDKVESCIGSLRSMKISHPLDDTHKIQTRRYVEAFGRLLENWASAEGRPQIRETTAANEIVSDLRRAAVQGSEQSASLLRTIEELRCPSDRDEVLPPSDFGQRTFSDGNSLFVNTEIAVQPGMTHSWPFAVRDGSVPIGTVLTDLLEVALRLAPTSELDVVDRLLKFREYEAARAAAGTDPQLVALVDAAMDVRREAFLRENAALLEQGAELRPYDEYIDLCLTETQRSLTESDFDAAQKAAVELEEFVRLRKRLRDPVRQVLASQLSEAGIEVTDDKTTSDLEADLWSLRQAESPRRRHIEALDVVGKQENLPARLRDAWRSIAQRIDRPSAWLQPEDSRRLAAAIDSYVKLLRGRAKFASSDQATFDVLSDSFEAWLPSQLSVLEPGTSDLERQKTIQTMVDLAGAIEEHAPDAHVLTLLGGISVSQRSVPHVPTFVPPMGTDGALRRGPEMGAPQPKEEQIAEDWGHIVDELIKMMEAEPPHSNAGIRPLKEAGLAKNWPLVRSMAATLGVSKAHETGRPSAADFVALFALAVSSMTLQESPTFRDSLERAALLLAGTRRAQLDFFLGKANLRLLFQNLLLEGLTGTRPTVADQTAVHDGVASVLAELAEATPDASREGFEWLSNLLYKASRVPSEDGTASGTIVFQLWDCLTGKKDVANPRSDLLYLLDRMGRSEELRFLARLSASPLEQLVNYCLSALEASRSNPEVRPLAQQLVAALREQSETEKVKLRPWMLFFTRLEGSPAEGATGPVNLLVDAGPVDALSGQALLEVRVVPTGYDVPTDLSLEIQLGSDSKAQPVTKKLLEDEALLAPRTCPIDIPLVGMQEVGTLNLAYRLTGKTVRNQPIDSRGRFVVEVFESLGSSIAPDDIARAWPGASGDPVKRGERGFHGRENEMRAVDEAIRGGERQRSVMVIGQRRVGKTSLLLEMVRSLPPKAGAPCGVFIDVSGLQIPAERGAMAGALFGSIVSQLAELDENGALRECLQGPKKAEVRRLARGLDPQVSLAAALDGLVDRFCDESGGVVPRLAIFVDEFDRFVGPYLSGRRDEVDALMWQLRQIVQRSNRISLVLAGSGLQRLFLENYEEALYGSLETVRVDPFTWEGDREAIESTFLPGLVRERLCRKEKQTEVCIHATNICGGHPWYLAILGRAAATIAKGRPFTISLLNRVLDQVARVDTADVTGGSALHNDPGRFYSPVFESLARLDDRGRPIAKAVLAHIAQRVTLEFPWLPLRDAQAPPDIVQETTDRERSHALQALERVQAIVVDRRASRVRIRTPITAVALRHRAVSLIEEASHELRHARLQQ
jgi:hypothetical protein